MSNLWDKKKEEPKEDKSKDTLGESSEAKAKRAADEITQRILDNQSKAK